MRMLSFVVALLVFLGWMRLVGNPHVVETVIGLVIAVVAGLWVNSKLRKAFERRRAASEGKAE